VSEADFVLGLCVQNRETGRDVQQGDIAAEYRGGSPIPEIRPADGHVAAELCDLPPTLPAAVVNDKGSYRSYSYCPHVVGSHEIQVGTRTESKLPLPPITGAIVTPALVFVAWPPSTWPATPAVVDENFIDTLKRIFEESILGEISNVLTDVQKANGGLHNRGHVLAISMMCALDAIASYGYRGRHFAVFISAHFPGDYPTHAGALYELYRNSLIHSWNLFGASIYPDDSEVREEGGTLAFGLLNFFDGFKAGVEDFLETLATDAVVQKNTLARYGKLRTTAEP
jgi:hypothetical protein